MRFQLEEMLVDGLAERTGFSVSAGAVRGSLLTGRFQLTEVAIENPDRFPVKDFLSIAGVTAHVSPTSLLGGAVKVKALQIHLRRLTGVRSENGTVNIAQFRKQLEGKKSSEEAVRKASEREIHIASLSIKVDQIATVDFSEGAEKRSEYSVGFERQFADVSDIFSVGPVLVQACEAVGLSRATDAIFATLLPDFLWGRIGEKGNAYSPA